MLFFYFCYKIINSGWIVGWLILKGYRGENEEIVEYHIQSDNPWHIILLFSLISMTPGSLSTDLSDDHSIIFVHLLNSKDRDDFYKTTNKIELMLLRTFSNRQLLF
jgi:multisubunit Na+/H+ antiporter MnhE subunit